MGAALAERFGSPKVGVIRPLVETEARARLTNVRDVCEHERQALQNLRDPRLKGVLQAISSLQAEIAAALASLHAPDANGGPGD